KGAQGVAQFMPRTAAWFGVNDPWDPIEAITKSAQLLRDLNRQFGNLGLAAAAYNAGGRRLQDWLAVGRSLPRETQAYVRIVTGHSVEEWKNADSHALAVSGSDEVPCQRTAMEVANRLGDTQPASIPGRTVGSAAAVATSVHTAGNSGN